MNILHKCFANKHYPNIKEYISPFGNISLSGYVHTYTHAGVHTEHWVEISFAEFAASAAPEAIVLIDFINTHKRLPNFLAAHIPYEHMKLHAKNT